MLYSSNFHKVRSTGYGCWGIFRTLRGKYPLDLQENLEKFSQLVAEITYCNGVSMIADEDDSKEGVE